MLSPATVARVAGALPELSGARVLEIGTGSGYQTALLSMLGAEVVSLDASQGCLSEARGRLKALGTPAVVEQSDGDAGYDGETRYDAIVVNVPLPAPPLNLLPRLEAGRGVVVAPVATSDGWQRLMRIELRNDQERVLDLGPCQFAPVTTTQRKELP
jgi:protein-L-isoaspartate(D-aspartate) O-methyltransferase